MKGLLAISALLAATALGAWSASSDAAGGAARATEPETITVRPGDRIRVAGAPIGCRVVRMKEFGGRAVIDCRRAGPLAGTYGTLISGREAVLIRFESKRAAKQVVCATQHGDVRRCE
jgi:hypothetical protein